MVLIFFHLDEYDLKQMLLIISGKYRPMYYYMFITMHCYNTYTYYVKPHIAPDSFESLKSIYFLLTHSVECCVLYFTITLIW